MNDSDTGSEAGWDAGYDEGYCNSSPGLENYDEIAPPEGSSLDFVEGWKESFMDGVREGNFDRWRRRVKNTRVPNTLTSYTL